MVLGILSAIAACPAIIGTTEAVRQGQRANAREKHRGQKSHLIVSLPRRNGYSQRFDGTGVVLRDSKLYVHLPTSEFGPGDPPHPFTGYYYPYPAHQTQWKAAGWRGEGLVSTISSDPPFLNWIYVDRATHEVKYGVRADAEPHHVGPWDCTEADRRVTFEGWEGFVAVQEDVERDLWKLYFDRDDDGLTGERMVGNEGRRMLLVELTRKEMPKTWQTAREERVERLRQMAWKEKTELEEALVQEVGSSEGGAAASRAETVVTVDDADVQVESARGDNYQQASVTSWIDGQEGREGQEEVSKHATNGHHHGTEPNQAEDIQPVSQPEPEDLPITAPYDHTAYPTNGTRTHTHTRTVTSAAEPDDLLSTHTNTSQTTANGDPLTSKNNKTDQPKLIEEMTRQAATSSVSYISGSGSFSDSFSREEPSEVKGERGGGGGSGTSITVNADRLDAIMNSMRGAGFTVSTSTSGDSDVETTRIDEEESVSTVQRVEERIDF